jgi:aryl carrier-like protein
MLQPDHSQLLLTHAEQLMHVADGDNLLDPGIDSAALLRLQVLEKDIPGRKASIRDLILKPHRVRILVCEVVAEGSPNHSSILKNLAKAAGCRPSLGHHHSQMKCHFRIGNHLTH